MGLILAFVIVMAAGIFVIVSESHRINKEREDEISKPHLANN